MQVTNILKAIDQNLLLVDKIKSDSRSDLLLCKKSGENYVLKVIKDAYEYERYVDGVNTLKILTKVNFKYCQFPEVVSHGFIDKTLFYILESHVDGTVLGSISDGITALSPSTKNKFPLVVKALNELSQVDRKPFGKLYHSGRMSKQIADEFKHAAVKWATDDIPHIAKLLNIVFDKIHKSALVRSAAYFDATPINLMTNKGKIVFFDTDLARSNYLKYYDYVEFYNRVFTRACSPEIAAAFLSEVIKSQRNKDRFFELIYPQLAFRAIGNYYEINKYLTKSKNYEKRLKYANQLINHVINKEFVL